MSITIDLPPYVETYLQTEAAKQETPVEEYTAQLIEDTVPPPQPKNGAELLALLEKEGIVGMWADRTDIGDSVEYARKLRKQAETRGRD